MYLTMSSRSVPWKCLNIAVTANNLSLGRLDKTNGDAQIIHVCFRSRIHNFISNLYLPEPSDMPPIWLLLLPLHSPDTLLKMLFFLSFTAPSSPVLPRHPWFSTLAPWVSVFVLSTVLGWYSHYYPSCLSPTYPQSNFSISEPDFVDAFPNSYTCLTSSYPHCWLCHPHTSLLLMLKQLFMVPHVILRVGVGQWTLLC